jgi:hypothetical protein
MEPRNGLDRFARRAVERKLVAQLHESHERLRIAIRSEHDAVLDLYMVALQRFTDFAAKGDVPQDCWPEPPIVPTKV